MTSAHTLPRHFAQQAWLKNYYYTRAGFSLAWVLLAATVAASSPVLAAVLLVSYPTWDALANMVDARRSGGPGANLIQVTNAVVSLTVAAAVYYALPDMNNVLAVFGVWAILAGLLQLGTGARRWKSFGAQWPMILSGAQSTLAGGAFIYQSQASAVPPISTLAGYAGFGALYFLIAAISLSVAGMRSQRA